MYTNRLVLSMFGMLIVCGIAACGSKNSSDSEQEQPANTKLENAGLFAGDLVSTAGVNAGVLHLQISGAETKAVLSGNVEAEIGAIELKDSGASLSKEVSVSGLASGIQLQAKFDGQTWTGTLSTPASKTAYTFMLTKVVELKVASESQHSAPEGVYSGAFKYPSGGSRAAKIVVTEVGDLGERLLALFTPRTSANLQIVYEGGSKESVTEATWNSDERTLVATGPAMTSLGAPQLQCVYDEFENLDCVLAMGKQSVGKGKFNRENPPVSTKPKPKPTPKPSATPQHAPDVAPPPNTSKNFGTERTFLGQGTFRDSSGKSKSRNVSIQVSLVATDIQGPVAAKVTFRVRESRVGANFRSSVYDSVDKTLRAEERLSMGALAGALVLTCKNFDFKATPYSFTCNYESTTTGVSGVFVMSGK